MSEDCFVLGKNEPFSLQEGRYLYLTHDLFDHDAIILTNIPEQVTLGSEKGNKKIIVKFAQMKYLGIWHRPGKKTNYVCIEPWSSLPSRKGIVEDIEIQPGLISLKAGDRYINTWSITIK